MSRTTVNIKRRNVISGIGNEGLTLVIFSLGEYTKGSGLSAGEVKKITSVNELYNTIKPRKPRSDTDYVGMGQLVNAEYLLRSGVPILAYIPAELNTFSNIDYKYLAEEVYGEEYNFVQAIVPYEFVEDSNSFVIKVIDELVKIASNLPIQMFADISPDKNLVEIETRVGVVTGKVSTVALAKVEVALNSINPLFTPYVEGLPAFKKEGYFGILGSTLIAARKALLLMNRRPWLPVAGEENGAVKDGAAIFTKYSKHTKKEIQDLNINLLTNKVGFGPLFVSQNTMYQNENNKYDPLIRSHVVTEALWIKRELQKLASKFEHSLSITKTADYLEAALRDFFNEIYKGNGIEEPANIEVILDNNKLIAYIDYIPIKAVEAIEINVTLIDDTVDVAVGHDGGNL